MSRLFLIALVAALLAGGAQGASIPTLYVQYSARCTFTIVNDSGAAIGSSIPSGSYQVDVTTPFPFAEGDEAATPPSCSYVQFNITGPGVNLYTDLQVGDRAEEILLASFQPNASYSIWDGNAQAATQRTVSVSSAVAAGPTPTPTPPATTTKSTTGGSQSDDVVGSALLQPRGSLAATVSAAGKLALTFKGKAVGTLKAGSYKLTVSDKTAKAGLELEKLYKNPITDMITTPKFVGTKSSTVKLVAGQWVFLTPGGKKSYFLVVA